MYQNQHIQCRTKFVVGGFIRSYGNFTWEPCRAGTTPYKTYPQITPFILWDTDFMPFTKFVMSFNTLVNNKAYSFVSNV